MNDEITREQVEAFRAEAARNGAVGWVAICELALIGELEAWNRCADAICALEWPW